MKIVKKQTLGQWILKQLYSANCVELLEKDPFIISCGGIFIPHKNENQKHHQYVLNCAKEEENVKVIGDEFKNPLFKLIVKEGMN